MMVLRVEVIFMTIVKFGGDDVLKSENDVHEMMARIRGELDRGAFFWHEVCVAVER